MKFIEIAPGTTSVDQLQCLIRSLTEKFQPEKIICFGKRITEHHESGCFLSSLNGYSCHYFLLIVTAATTRIEHEVQDFANAHYKGGKVTILVHGRETIEAAIRDHSRFFNTVYREAKLLYSADGMMQIGSYVQLNPQRTYEKALKHYQHRYHMALGFCEAASVNLDKGHYNNAVFLMHQVVEQACTAIIRVHIAYRSDIHHLGRLLDLCLCFSDEPADLFPRDTPNQERLFSILLRSYSDSRYKDEFKIGEADARLLFERVSDLLELTETLCTAKLKIFHEQAVEAKSEAEAVHKTESEVAGE